MSQHEERARAIKQARKLMEMTQGRGASETEAETAMKRLSDIRKTFNLTLDEIVISNLEYQKQSVEQTATKGCVMSTVVMDIANFTDTKVWRERGRVDLSRARSRRGWSYRQRQATPGTYEFFGIDSDVEMAVYLYDLIVKSLNVAEKVYRRSTEYNSIKVRGGKRRALVSFRKGFARRVSTRLSELALEQSRESETTAQTTGNDIVFIKSQVREEKFKEQVGIKLVKSHTYRHGPTDGRAAANGANSADSINFNRPVNGSSKNQKLLVG